MSKFVKYPFMFLLPDLYFLWERSQNLPKEQRTDPLLLLYLFIGRAAFIICLIKITKGA